MELAVESSQAHNEDLLNYTRTRNLNVEQTDVDRFVEDVIKELLLPDRVALDYDLRSGARVALDRDRMRQVIVNLVENASQSLAEPSDANRSSRITVASETVGDWVRIHFADDGPGVPEDIREKIFEPLYSTRAFGVGLGLPLVRQILEHHGGRIEIAPQSTAGSTFTISLPLATEPSR